jgi:hypothetical protein
LFEAAMLRSMFLYGNIPFYDLETPDREALNCSIVTLTYTYLSSQEKEKELLEFADTVGKIFEAKTDRDIQSAIDRQVEDNLGVPLDVEEFTAFMDYAAHHVLDDVEKAGLEQYAGEVTACRAIEEYTERNQYMQRRAGFLMSVAENVDHVLRARSFAGARSYMHVLAGKFQGNNEVVMLPEAGVLIGVAAKRSLALRRMRIGQ